MEGREINKTEGEYDSQNSKHESGVSFAASVPERAVVGCIK
jgi:hypothetical protein